MEEIKGLIVVFCVQLGAIILFNTFLFEKQFENDGKKISALILSLTCASFLISDFWMFLFVLFLFFAILIRIGIDVPRAFLVLFCVSPFIGRIMPGFGIVNQIMVITPIVFLCIFTIPIIFKSDCFKLRYKNNILMIDLIFFFYVFVLFFLSFRGDNITNGMREAVTRCIVIVVPYILFSRMVYTIEQLVKIIYAYVLVMFCFACVAILESAWGWHFYGAILYNWEDVRVKSQYKERAGYLRAYGSVYGPIAFGYMIALATGLCLSIRSHVGSTIRVSIVLGVLLAGIAATLSRGPLLGAFAIIVLFLLLNTAFERRLSPALLPIGIVGLLTLGSGQIAGLVELLPIIGGVQQETIDYRNDLIDSSLELIWRYPLFGSEEFRSDLAEMGLVQGQGIVDVVNTYLSVLLNFGFVGLGGFIAIWIAVILRIQRALADTQSDKTELHDLCSGFLATLIGSLLMIATTSSVKHVPGMYWALAGLSIALTRLVFDKSSEIKKDNFP